MKKIDLTTWPRADHFRFFKSFDKPQFNITTSVDFSNLYRFSKLQGYSFTDCYLYCLLKAVNEYKPMKLRIVDDAPVEVDDVMASIVFLRHDETFRFVPLNRQLNITEFCLHSAKQKAHYLEQTLMDENFLLREMHVAQIHVSILPWFNFSSFSHASHESAQCAGIPKFVFGKYDKGTGMMPINIEVHHALVDGVHVAQFLTTLNEVISSTAKLSG